MTAYRPDDMDLYGDDGLGTLAREIVADYPVLSLGAGVSAVVMCLVAVNALWFQPEPHPAPIFATRTPVAAQTVEVARAPVLDAAPAKPAVSPVQREVMREIQTALTERGYYKGDVDGVVGSRTRAAIAAFQSDRGLEPSGKASVGLLTAILSQPAAAVEVPVPSYRSPREPDVIETASVNEEVTPRLVVDIQRGLREYSGLDSLAIDGRMGSRTREAIKAFELELGWEITGKPSPRIVRQLRKMGVLEG